MLSNGARIAFLTSLFLATTASALAAGESCEPIINDIASIQEKSASDLETLAQTLLECSSDKLVTGGLAEATIAEKAQKAGKKTARERFEAGYRKIFDAYNNLKGSPNPKAAEDLFKEAGSQIQDLKSSELNSSMAAMGINGAINNMNMNVSKCKSAMGPMGNLFNELRGKGLEKGVAKLEKLQACALTWMGEKKRFQIAGQDAQDSSAAQGAVAAP